MSPDQDVQKEIEQLEQRFAENAQGLVFAHLADAYRRAGEFAKAEGLLLHGLKTHATYTSAYNVLGRVYLDSERLADAHQQFSKVLELDPQNLIALRALGDLAARGGRVEDARSWYERMLHIDPRSDEAREGLSKLETQGEPEEPVAAEASAIAESPDADAPAEASALETLDAEVSGEAALAAEPPSEAGVAAGEGQETWDIEALLADDTSSSAESGVEAVEGLIDSEVGLTDLQGRSSEMEPELGEPAIDAGAVADEAPPPPPTEATSDLESAFATDSFSLDDLDLGIIDDWTPGMARSADEVSSERTGSIAN
jgi:tetratricopeptide (TPR) repeat protein